ncbi:MAG: primosomal protein N' [Actinomycetaceae bacterium]|nr:primosomal protein N' [Actinomycetaceae bacterium]MDU0969494.1 primosomal protein N' [Actinomycetaceae bacterium]
MSAAQDQMALWAEEPSQRTIRSTVTNPVVRVLVDSSLPHLDHLFDYVVDEKWDAQAQPGRRCRVHFAGSLVTAWIIERAATTTHTGKLSPIERVLDGVAALTPQVFQVCQRLAQRYAGVTADVISQAVPPRHARAEADVLQVSISVDFPTQQAQVGDWESYGGGAAFIRHLADGDAPRAVWQALPGLGPTEPFAALADAAAACLASGRGVILIVPTATQVGQLAAVLRSRLGQGEPIVSYHAGLDKEARYRAFLAVLLGRCRVVVGTRSAAFAPLENLGLIAVWDDGADALRSDRQPYVHARVGALTRARVARCGVLIGGYTRTVACQKLAESGWAHPLVAPRALVRQRTPRIDVVSESRRDQLGPAGRGRLPAFVQSTLRHGLESGPVLVQVPLAGHTPLVVCTRCGEPARCVRCAGPLGASRTGTLTCGWCGALATEFACAACGTTSWRSAAVGSERTAEDLGRALPGAVVVSSGAASGIVDALDSQPRLVVATPGAEPRAEGGYTAAAVLDAHVLLSRPEMWAPSEALRRWFGAAALVRPGAPFVVLGDVSTALAQTLIRWDASGWARSTLEERCELRFPPATTMIALEGAPDAVADFLRRLGDDWEILGPLAVGDDTQRALVRADPEDADALRTRVREVAAARSIRRLDRVRIQVDPPSI